jgi:hypothetical protein
LHAYPPRRARTKRLRYASVWVQAEIGVTLRSTAHGCVLTLRLVRGEGGVKFKLRGLGLSVHAPRMPEGQVAEQDGSCAARRTRRAKTS